MVIRQVCYHVEKHWLHISAMKWEVRYTSNKEILSFVDSVTEDDLAMTCGVSGAIDLVLQLFSKPGDQIIVEDPTYYEAKNFIEQYELQVSSTLNQATI